MSTPSTAVERLRDELEGLSDVRLAFLFGSRASAHARKESDFDIAVLLEPASAAAERGAAIRRLAGHLGRAVSSSHLDLVILNDAPLLLRHRILRDGVLLLARTPEERVRFAIRTIREYQDSYVRRERATRARIHRLRAGTDDGRSRDLLEEARGAARLLGKASRLP